MTKWNEHNQINTEELLKKIKATGYIGRHKYKNCNAKINKRLRKLVREKVLVKFDESRDYCYFKLRETL